MADTKARVNQTTPWTTTGTSDTITCDDIAPGMRNGVQVDIDGVAISTTTIVVTTRGGAEVTPSVASIVGESVLVGQGYSISKIVISGVAAGTRNVTFSQ